MNDLKTMLFNPAYACGIFNPSMMIIRIANKLYASIFSEFWQAFGDFSEVEDLDQIDSYISANDIDLTKFRPMTNEELFYARGMIDLDE